VSAGYDPSPMNRRIWAILRLAIAGAAGVVVAAFGLSPVGESVLDALLSTSAVAAVVWFASGAPWLAVAGAATISFGVGDPVFALVGVVFAAASARPGEWRIAVRALGAAAVVISLARSDIDLFHGASTIVGVAVALVLVALGLAAMPAAPRRGALRAVGATACAVVAATVLFGVAAFAARDELVDGDVLARSGLEQLRAGDIEGAEASFRSASTSLDRADRWLGSPLAAPSRLVPLLAQQRSGVSAMSGAARDALGTIVEELDTIDIDALTSEPGAIDIGAVRDLEAPLTRLRVAVDELDAALGDARNPWHLDQIQRRMSELSSLAQRQSIAGDDVLEVIRAAPELLGADRPRVYFVALTTPVQARGHGGFMGNWAELTIDRGRVEMTDFGRSDDLAGGRFVKEVSGPAEWLELWESFGFDDEIRGAGGPRAWKNLTMSPHFPSMAQVITELYPQSGGQPLDGVFAADVYAVSALFDLTGPLTVEGVDGELDASSSAELLLRGQYRLDEDNAARIDLLENVATTVLDALLEQPLPPPARIAEVMSPFIAEGRITAAATRPEEQALWERLGVTGALPERGDGDGLAVVFNNVQPNKIDDYLDVVVRYDAYPDFDGGVSRARARITITNSAPSTGEPVLVIGPGYPRPLGTNQTMMVLYSALDVVDATIDGDPLSMPTAGAEYGYRTARAYVGVSPGQTCEVVVELRGTLLLSDTYRLAIRSHPAVRPFPHTVVVHGSSGVLAQAAFDAPGRHDLVVGADHGANDLAANRAILQNGG
jgi:hypothetical protein